MGPAITIFCTLRSNFVLFLSVTMGTLALDAKAQSCGVNAQSPIATDRPQITNSSVVVPCGSLQFENGFQETGNGNQPIFDLPETAVRFGIASKTSSDLGDEAKQSQSLRRGRESLAWLV